MAPEVMEQLHGYNFKDDIWSFGITALELAHGHAPFSKFPPLKVLLMTLQNAPPSLDYERDRKFSKSFKQMIACCLVKDPTKRPSASKLLKHSFFKQARSSDYIGRTLLEGLPALGDRMEALKRKEEDMLAQKKMPDGQMEELSQNKYKRGISRWNFNLEDMKAQASLINDFDDAISDIHHVGSSCSLSTLDVQDKQLPSASHNHTQSVDLVALMVPPSQEEIGEMHSRSASLPVVDSTVIDAKTKIEKSDDDSSITSSSHEPQTSSFLDDHVDHSVGEKSDLENIRKSSEGTTTHYHHRRGCSSSILPEVTLPPIRAESEKPQSLNQNASIGNATSAPIIGEDVLTELPTKISKSSANSDDLDDKAKIPVVQQRGRFKVTSENVDPDKVVPSPILQKSHSMQETTWVVGY